MVFMANWANYPIFYPQKNYIREERWGKLGDRIAPSLSIIVSKPGGKNTTEYPSNILEQHLLSIEVEEDIKMTSKLSMTLSNPEFLMSDSEMITAGTQFDVFLGWGFCREHFGRRFEMVHQTPMFPRSEIPTLNITAYDGRHRMTFGDKLIDDAQLSAKARKETAKRRRFTNKRDDQIIVELAEIYKFAADVNRTDGKRTRVKKRGRSDWEFILHLAKFNDFEVWVDWDLSIGWVLHFRKEDIRKPTDYHHFVYGDMMDDQTNLLECFPELEVSKQSTDIEVLSYDRRLRKVNASELSETKQVVVKSIRGGIKSGKVLESVDYGAKVRFSAFGRTMEVISNRPFKNKKDAKRHVENYLRSRERDFLTCTGTVIGIENLRPRQIHYLDGLGAKFSGFYKFIQVTHKWQKDGIYETDFVAYKMIPEEAQLHRKVKASVVDYEGEV